MASSIKPLALPIMGWSARSYESKESQDEFMEPDQTLFVYDWDDTLCPTCWVQDCDLSFFRPPPKEDRFVKPLRMLERLVEGLIVTSKQLGHVVIVTNAQEPWVESSCKNLMPNLEPLLKTIPVRYARAIHSKASAAAKESKEQVRDHPALRAATRELERQATEALSGTVGTLGGLGAPGIFSLPPVASVATTESLIDFEVAPQQWKETAFKQEIDRFYSRYESQSWKNVVSIGDATFERDATRAAVSSRPSKRFQCRTKTVKMLDEPSIEELIKQVKIIHDAITMIARYDGNLDLQIADKDLAFDMSVVEKLIEDQ